MLIAALVVPVVLITRGFEVVRRAVVKDWPRHLAGGVATLGSYGLLLYASRLAPLSLAAAARETAVVFAALGGWWFLDEKIGKVRRRGGGYRGWHDRAGHYPLTPSARPVP